MIIYIKIFYGSTTIREDEVEPIIIIGMVTA